MKVEVRRPGTIAHRCAACNDVHVIDIHALNRDGNVVGWDGDRESPSIATVVTVETPKGTCEYLLRGGVQHFTGASWHGIRQRHLEDMETRKDTP